ncbi:MAG TPA: tetratricopeptide repeat protein [Casimicrobiaceae bacterium]|nr:tetratricopeptide repeat protein [Casimicrobiaceae bacterium]
MRITLADAFVRALAADRRGDRRTARAIYDDILKTLPEHPGALLGIARQMRAAGDFDGARATLRRALQSAGALGLPPAELWVELGGLHFAAGRLTEARDAYAAALCDSPQSLSALLGAGDVELAASAFTSAERHFRNALAQDARRPSAWIGLAQALAGPGHFDEARAAFRRALEMDPSNPGAFAAAAWVELRAKDWRSAQDHCRAGLAVAPGDPALLELLGQALKAAGAFAAARPAFEASIEADPGRVSARIGLGAVLLDLGLADDAREQLGIALAKGDRSAATYANLGLAWRLGDDHASAASMFERALDADPAFTPALADLVHSRQYLCAWEGLDALVSRLASMADDPESDPRLSPFVALTLPLSAAQRLAVARRWSREMLPAAAPAFVHARGSRLRIGYVSRDFRDHAMGRLIVGLIESHDRRRVEVFGYGYGAAADSPLRQRIAAAFDHWRDLASASDREIAQAIRADRIDVLIECTGHTRGGRLAPLAERPASVQLHYLGFPGTLGFDAIDGIVADETVVPLAEDGSCHERVFRLPRCYFVTDGGRDVPQRPLRADHGLPDDAIVLASMNQTYKLTRDMFSIWMEALNAEPRAVLWLYAQHPRVQANLRAEAARKGVAGGRLVFAQPLEQDAHIGRLRCADLALDTLPYGSHTTGVDALWAGVPMLTCRGAAFAGRVGASLLSAVGLPELVTADLREYRRRLLDLMADPAPLRGFAMHLDRGRGTLPLWDTRAFAADFERLLERAYDEVTSSR